MSDDEVDGAVKDNNTRKRVYPLKGVPLFKGTNLIPFYTHNACRET